MRRFAWLSACILVLKASSYRNVLGCAGGAGGYAYPTVPTHRQQPQVQAGHPRPPPPPPPRNFPVQPAYLNGNQVPRSLVTYQSGTGHDNRPPSLFPEAFPQEAFPVTHASANYGIPTPSRPGSHEPPVLSGSGGYEFGRSPGPQTHISLPRAYVSQTA